MKIKELREYMNEYEQKIETHKNNWTIMSNFVIINNITLNNIRSIRIVEGANGEPRIWLNENHMRLEDVEELTILKVRSYLKGDEE